MTTVFVSERRRVHEFINSNSPLPINRLALGLGTGPSTGSSHTHACHGCAARRLAGGTVMRLSGRGGVTSGLRRNADSAQRKTEKRSAGVPVRIGRDSPRRHRGTPPLK